MTRHMPIVWVVAVCMIGLLTLTPESSRSSLAQQPPSPGSSGPIKTLLVTAVRSTTAKHRRHRRGGDEESGLFDITRAHEDLNAFLPSASPVRPGVFYYTLGKITEAQKRGLMNHIAPARATPLSTQGRTRSVRIPTTVPSWRLLQDAPTLSAVPGEHHEGENPITKGIDEFMITDEQYILDYDRA